MALYDTRFGLPQSMVDYLNQGLPDIYQNIYNPPPKTIGPITTMPVESKPLLDSLYPQTGGNEEGFSVYNPDPNMTRTKRNYVNPFKFTGEDLPEAGDYITPPRTGIMGLYDQYQNLPTGSKIGLGTMSALSGGAILPMAAGVVGIGKLLSGMLPPSRAGIMQNELLGANFMLDNTGRIVAAPGKYNTPEGIMAGYNLTAREQDFDDPKNVFNKRDTNIRNTLKDKYKLDDEQINQVLSEIEEKGEYKGPFGYNETLGKTTNLFEDLFNINKARNIVKDRQTAADIIYNKKIEERKEKALEKQNQERIARETRQKAEAARKNQTYTGGSDRQNVVDRNTGRRDATGGDRGSKGASDRFSNKSGRGRTGY